MKPTFCLAVAEAAEAAEAFRAVSPALCVRSFHVLALTGAV